MTSTTFYERRKEVKQVDFNDRRIAERRSHAKVISQEQRRLASRIRRYDREAFMIPVRLQMQGKTVSGYTHDISPDGLLAFSDTVFNPGTSMALQFSFREGVCHLNISGQVVFCRLAENGESPRQAIGIKFSAIRDFEQKILTFAVQDLKQNTATQEKSLLSILVSLDTLALEAASLSDAPLQMSQHRAERRKLNLSANASRFNYRVEQVKGQGLYHYMRTLDSLNGPRVRFNGREMIMLASLDYLGLTTHPKVREAAIKAIEKYGTGSGGTGFLYRALDLHEELETKLAKFKGTEAAMLYSTGYMANSGMIATLFGNKDILIVDEKSHISTFQGCRTAKCITRIYRHNDICDLERILKRYSSKPGEKVILTESIFGADGDMADLPAIFQLAQEHDAALVIDENHATGVLGKNGRGAAEHYGLIGQVDIMTDSFGKALGAIGGYVVASNEIITYLKHFSSKFIFTTNLPPSVCAALLAALQVVYEEPDLRHKLLENAKVMREGLKRLGFNLGRSETQIIPIIIGDEEKTNKFTGILQKLGVFVAPIVRPGVKRGEERVRVTVMATHTAEDLVMALRAFETAGGKLGII